MLRNIKNRFTRPRVMGYIMTNAGTPSITDGCKDDVSSVTDNSAGNSTINFYEPFQRTPITLVAAAGGTGAIPAVVTSAAASARVLTSNSAGSATDMNAHVMCFGFDSADTNSRGPNRSLARAGRLAPVLFGFRFNSSGGVLSGARQVSVSAATSTFTVTLKAPFASAPVVIPICTGSTAGVAKVTSASGSQIVIDTFDAAGSGAAFGCHVFVLGWYSAEYCRSRRTELDCPQRLPRLEVYEVTVTAGVPAISIGTGGIADDGTGLFTITHTEPFKRAPQVVSCADGSTISTLVSSSISATQIKTYDNAGNAADAGKVYVACLGYDTADKF